MIEKKPPIEANWAEIASLILAARGISAGLWRLSVRIRFGATNMNFADISSEGGPITTLPSSFSALEAIALFPAEEPGPLVFDAAGPPKSVAIHATPSKSRKTKAAPVRAAKAAKASTESRQLATPRSSQTRQGRVKAKG